MRKHCEAEMKLVNKLPVFEHWPLAQVASCFKHFQRLKFAYNSTIYEQGATDSSLYVVLQGEVEVRFADLDYASPHSTASQDSVS